MDVKKIENVDALIKTLLALKKVNSENRLSGGEIIIFPAKNEGRRFLEFLRYTSRLHYICCIAADTTHSENIFNNLRPVIPLGLLPHFRETGAFIVASPESMIEELNQKLVDFGCKTIYFLSESLNKEISAKLKQLRDSGDIAMWHENYMFNKMSSLEYHISMQNEICKTNTTAFEPYRNCYRGKKVVLVGSGPTMNYYKPIPGAIHIGLNRAFIREDLPLDFLFSLDSGGGSRISGGVQLQDGFYRISNRIFIGKTANTFGGGYNEGISFKGDNVFRYFYFVGTNPLEHLIYQDISCHPLTNFNSIFSAGFQFALFTYPSEFYLVGCDVSHGHFFYFDDRDFQNKMNVTAAKVGYARLKRFARRFYPDTKIISINPVGLKGLFKDVYTDEYKAAVAEQGEEAWLPKKIPATFTPQKAKKT